MDTSKVKYMTMANAVYTPVWNKYRPAILKLMLDSQEEPQSYRLFAHEFSALNSRPKGGHQFNLQVSNGRAINNIKESIVAQDLLSILQQSRKASELMETGSYEIRLDKNFILHIQKL
jgi:hypothetical protein